MRRFLSNLDLYWWLLRHCSCDERHEGTTEVMFGEGDNGIIGFSLQQIQEMSCALLMQSGKVILSGIGFYRVHSPRGQSFLVHYGRIVALGSSWRWDFFHSIAEGNPQDEILAPVGDFFIAGPDFFIVRVVVPIGCLFILDLEMFGWLLCYPVT